MFCCAPKKSHDREFEDGEDGAKKPSILPPKNYVRHPKRAMQRFRLTADARRLFDLETESENLEALVKKLAKKKRELVSELEEIEVELTKHNARQSEVKEQISNEVQASVQAQFGSDGEVNVGTLGLPADDGDEASFVSAIAGSEGEEFYYEDDVDEEGYEFTSPMGMGRIMPVDKDNGSEAGVARTASSVSDDQLSDVQVFNELKKNHTNVLCTKTFRPHPVGAAKHSWRFPVNNELFEGEMLQVFRDSDPGNNGPYHAGLFAGKRRVYVCQMQGRFKRKPRGPICLILNLLDDKVKLGMISKRLAKMWLSFAQAWEPQLDMCTSPSKNCPIGLCMPVNVKWMGILWTKPGDPLPELGKNLPPFKECAALNKAAGITELGAEDVRLDGTYTFEFYSQNLDLLGWKIFNIPVMPEVSLNRFTSSWPKIPVPCNGFITGLREMGDQATKFNTDSDAQDLGCFINVRRFKD